MKYRGNFAKCKFDSTHQYPEPYIKHHEAQCPARRLLDRDRQLMASSGDTLMGDVKGPEIIAARFDNDEWDLECSPENSGRGMFTCLHRHNDEDDRNKEEIRQKLRTLKPLGHKQYCSFCRNNKEESCVYNTHVIKDEFGNVTCPILQRYSCPKCGATGKRAHTVKYCPLGDVIPTVDCLLKTPRNSTRRRHDSTSSQSPPKSWTFQKPSPPQGRPIYGRQGFY